MKNTHLRLSKGLFTSLMLLWLTAAMPALAAVETAPKKSSFSKAQRADIEIIIKEYLMKNPLLMQEILQAQKGQEEALSAQKIKQAISAYRDALLNSPNSPVAGNPQGDVSVVEFFDYQCGYCKKVSPVIAELIAKDPNVRVVLKDFPILGPESVYAARAALAANKQGKYAAFHDALMASQMIDESVVKGIAAKLGMSSPRLLADMEDAAIQKTIDENYNLANMLGIGGTPAFVIGDTLLPGATDLTGLMAYVSAERTRLKSQAK